LQKVANIPQDATEAQVTIALTDTVQESKLVSVDPASRSATWDNETIISTRCLFDREEGTKSLADIKASVTVKLSNNKSLFDLSLVQYAQTTEDSSKYPVTLQDKTGLQVTLVVAIRRSESSSSKSKDKDKSSKDKKKTFSISLSAPETTSEDTSKQPLSAPADTTTTPVNISVIDPNHTPQKQSTVSTSSSVRRTSSSGSLSKSMDKVKLKRKESREIVLQSIGGAINEEPEPVSARLDIQGMRRTTSERLPVSPSNDIGDNEKPKKDKRKSDSRRKKRESTGSEKTNENEDDKSKQDNNETPLKGTDGDQSTTMENSPRSPSDNTSPSRTSDDFITSKDSAGSMSQSSPVLNRKQIKMATINIQLLDKKEKSPRTPRSPRRSPHHLSDDPEIKEIKEKEIKMLREHMEIPVIPIEPMSLPAESTSSEAAGEAANNLAVPSLDSGPQSGPKSVAPQRLMNKRVGHRRVKSFDVDKLPYAAGINPETLSPRTDDALQLKIELAQKRLDEDSKFLLETVMAMDPRFSNKIPVVAYIIHKCLTQWHAFDIDNDKIISRLISTFDLFAKKNREKLTGLMYWLGTVQTVYYFTKTSREDFNFDVSPAERSNMRDFENNLRGVADLIVTYLFELLDRKMGSVVKNVFLTLPKYLVDPTVNMKAEENITNLTEILADVFKNMTQNNIIDGLKYQIQLLIFEYLDTRLLQLMMEHSSCGMGLQLKMAMSQLEEWLTTTNPLCSSMIQQATKASRQAADVLCLRQKESLVQDSTRESVCPDLAVRHLKKLLVNYKPDIFDDTVLNKSELDALSAKEKKEGGVRKSRSFASRISLDSVTTEFDDVKPEQIVIPKIVIDRPSFSFLKSKSVQSVDLSASDAILSEAW
jgi:hypothetical protein